MTAPPDSNATVISDDLSCANCGYNLRTLAVSGRCPECGELVARSFTPVGFRFRNPMTPRRIRNGIAVVIVAVLLSTVLKLALMGMVYLSWVSREGPLSVPFKVAAPAADHAIDGVGLLMLIGLILATWPFGRRGDRFLRPLGIGVAALGAGCSLYTIIIQVPWFSRGPSTYWGGVRVLVGLPALLTASALAFTLAWVHLLARVRYGRNRALWFAALGALMVQAVFLAGYTSHLAWWIDNARHMTVSGTGIRMTIQPVGPVLKTFSLPTSLGVSRHRIEGIASLVTVGALWLYLRKLRAAGTPTALGPMAQARRSQRLGADTG